MNRKADAPSVPHGLNRTEESIVTLTFVMEGLAMNFSSKFDRVPEPWSTRIGVTTTAILGIAAAFLLHAHSLGLGILIGAVSAWILKSILEASDRRLFSAILGAFRNRAS